MQVVALIDSAPGLAAVLGPILAIMLAMMRYQHVDNAKTRTLMYQLFERYNGELREEIGDARREFREEIGDARREFREEIEKSCGENRELIRENRELIEKNHSELTGSLGEVRERLAFIEGYLRKSLPPPTDGEAEAA